MSAWHDNISPAALQRITTLSAFNDPESKTLMLQTLYEELEKTIEDYKATNHELAQDYAELEKENRELKSFIKDLIYENHNLCFQFSNTTCLFNSDYRNRAEELTGEKL